jgi:anaerobic selenocysteine-containing dehydrogenase
MIQKHFRTCNLCEAMCGVVIEHEAQKILSIRGDEDDPLSRGHICPKAVSLGDIHQDPDRLREPLKRTASGWETISWEQAFDEVTAKLKELQRKYGRHSIGVYQGNPTVHNYGSLLFGQLFVRSLHTKNNFSATSVDQLPHMLSAFAMFGHQLLMPIPDIDRTQYFLVLGANPMVSNGSIMTAPDLKKRLQALKARGGKLVVIDPRHTETAQLADTHLFITPAADVFFLASLLFVIFEEELAKAGRVEAFTEGLPELQSAVQPYSPEATATMTGIDAEETRKIARAFCAAPSAVCYGRMGACTQEFGGLNAWLINAINLVTGNLDREGGSMFTLPAVDVVSASARIGMQGRFNRYQSRVRGLPEFSGELPAAALAEDILLPGAGQIRALVTSAGNPVLSTPNGQKLEDALEGLELMVSIDIYLNETTKHAHYILPPTFGLEHDNYDVAFHVFSIRNTAKYSPALFERPANARHDWEIFSSLAARMGKVDGPLGELLTKAKTLLGKQLTPTMLIDLGLRMGPYGDHYNPFNRDGLSLKKVKQSPHGIDLGPLKPLLPNRLYTHDKRIQLAPKLFLQDLQRAQEKLSQSVPSQGLVLIGRRELRSNNSWGHNTLRMVKGKERCTLLMHPNDAAALQLSEGQKVRVTSRVGRVEVPLAISLEVMPGVVSLPHGWGHTRKNTKQQIASEHAGQSLNDLTDESRIDTLTGTAAFSGTPVVVLGLG